MKRILLAQPHYGPIESESYLAAQRCRDKNHNIEVTVCRKTCSLLAHNFNNHLTACLNNDYDYFAMLHPDIEAQDGWLSLLLDELELVDGDVIHAPVAIKNQDGFTSTAIAYEDDDWSLKRRITTTELQKLPETFDAEIIRHHLDQDALWLLPNTGCMLMRAGTWLKDFPGFTIRDRVHREGDCWLSDVLPEDWNFGFWCGRNGVEVFGTRKVITKHYGRMAHPSNQAWGHATDIGWEAAKNGQHHIKIEHEELVV